MNHPYGTEASYFQGLNEMSGLDSEVAEDLGIPSSPESYERHLASAQAVKEALARAAIDGADEHAAVEEAEGRVICANCNRPGCAGCGRS